MIGMDPAVVSCREIVLGMLKRRKRTGPKIRYSAFLHEDGAPAVKIELAGRVQPLEIYFEPEGICVIEQPGAEWNTFKYDDRWRWRQLCDQLRRYGIEIPDDADDRVLEDWEARKRQR
jgi:hypothetical protein